ncbi:hypothetical protein ACBR40_45720 [Nonomuraea sp. AD125B]|uniref:hypothetical protein n=1 Tax=Nonomuraea sp. AD125B TaxID=3242897 RepID=UPI0035274233
MAGAENVDGSGHGVGRGAARAGRDIIVALFTNFVVVGLGILGKLITGLSSTTVQHLLFAAAMIVIGVAAGRRWWRRFSMLAGVLGNIVAAAVLFYVSWLLHRPALLVGSYLLLWSLFMFCAVAYRARTGQKMRVRRVQDVIAFFATLATGWVLLLYFVVALWQQPATSGLPDTGLGATGKAIGQALYWLQWSGIVAIPIATLLLIGLFFLITGDSDKNADETGDV